MWQKNVRYLDYNATSGVSPRVKEKLIELLGREELLANPSSRHRLGQGVQHLLYEAQIRVSCSLGADVKTDDIVFTASGTESNQTVLRSLARTCDGMILGSGEHSASYDLLSEFKLPFVQELPLSPSGQYDLSALSNCLKDAKEKGCSKIGLSLFWANNETGVLTDLSKLKSVIDDSGLTVLLHLDGAQVWGKLAFDVKNTPAAFVTFSSHKIGAPAGVGVIWIRPDSEFHPLIPGTQAKSRRGGTENILGIVAVGEAALNLDPEKFIAHTSRLRDQLEEGLLKLSHPITIWGSESSRVSNTTRFSFCDFKTYENWVELLDLKGFAVSHGSACKARVIEPSRVLLKMGVDRNDALNSIRISFGPSNTMEDVSVFLETLEQVILRKKENSNRIGKNA